MFLSLFLTSCGGSDVQVDIVLSSTDTTNALKKISTDMQLGLSTGIYFVLDELKALPISIDDLVAGGDNHSDPSLNGIGSDPLQGSFKISTSSLRPNSYYRVKMIAKDANGAITHTGVGDCPMKISIKDQNRVKICFGVNNPSNPPACPGLTAFNDCPGL